MALLELRRTVRDLERKQREVEAATAQRDSFMATVSHEIRGPLTAVIGYVELLRAGLPDDERSEVLASVALPISRLLAEKMGGSLTYRYEVGRSVFELELPMHSE